MYTQIENKLTEIAIYIWHKNPEWGFLRCENAVSDLTWYIETGRASTPFLKAFLDAKTFMLGRLIMKGGSRSEVVERVKKYLGFTETLI